VLAIVLALASAIGYGGSDFAAGLASRSAPVIQITLLASVISGVIVAAALLFIGLDRAGSGSGMWPVAAAAAGELASALVAAVAVRSFTLCGGRARLLAVIAGAGGAAGTILFFFATHQGFLAVTAVLTSLYPATTIVLARTVLGERLTALRLAGLGLAGVCVSLIAVGGAG